MPTERREVGVCLKRSNRARHNQESITTEIRKGDHVRVGLACELRLEWRWLWIKAGERRCFDEHKLGLLIKGPGGKGWVLPEERREATSGEGTCVPICEAWIVLEQVEELSKGQPPAALSDFEALSLRDVCDSGFPHCAAAQRLGAQPHQTG